MPKTYEELLAESPLVTTIDEHGRKHSHYVSPRLASPETFQAHADRMNVWTHEMMTQAFAGADMSPEWWNGETPNSHYIVSFTIERT